MNFFKKRAGRGIYYELYGVTLDPLLAVAVFRRVVPFASKRLVVRHEELDERL